jgi:hypothetical protein
VIRSTEWKNTASSTVSHKCGAGGSSAESSLSIFAMDISGVTGDEPVLLPDLAIRGDLDSLNIFVCNLRSLIRSIPFTFSSDMISNRDVGLLITHGDSEIP